MLDILVWESNENTVALHVNCRPDIINLMVIHSVEIQRRNIHTH